jgi:hypothetical protein
MHTSCIAGAKEGKCGLHASGLGRQIKKRREKNFLSVLVLRVPLIGHVSDIGSILEMFCFYMHSLVLCGESVLLVQIMLE